MSLQSLLDDIGAAVKKYIQCDNTYETRGNITSDVYTVLHNYCDLLATYEVICDDTNNTPIVLADGRLIAKIVYISVATGVETTINCNMTLTNDPMAAFDAAMKGV